MSRQPNFEAMVSRIHEQLGIERGVPNQGSIDEDLCAFGLDLQAERADFPPARVEDLSGLLGDLGLFPWRQSRQAKRGVLGSVATTA